MPVLSFLLRRPEGDEARRAVVRPISRNLLAERVHDRSLAARRFGRSMSALRMISTVDDPQADSPTPPGIRWLAGDGPPGGHRWEYPVSGTAQSGDGGESPTLRCPCSGPPSFPFPRGSMTRTMLALVNVDLHARVGPEPERAPCRLPRGRTTMTVRRSPRAVTTRVVLLDRADQAPSASSPAAAGAGSSGSRRAPMIGRKGRMIGRGSAHRRAGFGQGRPWPNLRGGRLGDPGPRRPRGLGAVRCRGGRAGVVAGAGEAAGRPGS